MTLKYNFLFLIFITVILQSTSFVILKYGTIYGGTFQVILFFVALFIMLSRAVVWQKVLNIVSLSKAYPFTLLTQVLIVLYGVLLFNESFTFVQSLGLLLICSGLVIIYRDTK